MLFLIIVLQTLRFDVETASPRQPVPILTLCICWINFGSDITTVAYLEKPIVQWGPVFYNNDQFETSK